MVMGAKHVPLADRLERNSKAAPNGCRLWLGALTPNGYGIIWDDSRAKNVHRVAYVLKYGPVPKGLELHHICKNRNCINPRHLIPLSPKAHKTAHRLKK